MKRHAIFNDSVIEVLLLTDFLNYWGEFYPIRYDWQPLDFITIPGRGWYSLILDFEITATHIRTIIRYRPRHYDDYMVELRELSLDGDLIESPKTD